MASILASVIGEVFIEFNESIGKQSISFLANLVSECTDTDDLKEQFKIFCKKHSILKEDEKDQLYEKVVDTIKNNKEVVNQLPNDHPLVVNNNSNFKKNNNNDKNDENEIKP